MWYILGRAKRWPKIYHKCILLLLHDYIINYTCIYIYIYTHLYTYIDTHIYLSLSLSLSFSLSLSLSLSLFSSLARSLSLFLARSLARSLSLLDRRLDAARRTCSGQLQGEVKYPLRFSVQTVALLRLLCSAPSCSPDRHCLQIDGLARFLRTAQRPRARKGAPFVAWSPPPRGQGGRDKHGSAPLPAGGPRARRARPSARPGPARACRAAGTVVHAPLQADVVQAALPDPVAEAHGRPPRPLARAATEGALAQAQARNRARNRAIAPSSG